MDTGIATFPTHDSIQPGPLARLVEEHGHAALFFAEHTHIPASRESPWAGGDTLPRKYSHTYDLFVAMAASVAATSRLRVGGGRGVGAPLAAGGGRRALPGAGARPNHPGEGGGEPRLPLGRADR